MHQNFAPRNPAQNSGDTSAVVPPVPIPNTAVKRCSPDGSAAIGRARVGRRQNKTPAEFTQRAFCFWRKPEYAALGSRRIDGQAREGNGRVSGSERVNKNAGFISAGFLRESVRQRRRRTAGAASIFRPARVSGEQNGCLRINRASLGATLFPLNAQRSTLNAQRFLQPQRKVLFQVGHDITQLFHHAWLADYFVDLQIFVDANVFRRKVTG